MSATILIGGALGLALGMPNPLMQIPPAVLAYPLCLFLLGRSADGWIAALRRGWLCGVCGAAAAMYWIAVPVHDFGGLPWVSAVPCALAVGAYLGLYGGLFAVAARLVRPLSPLRQAAAAGLIWYLLEAARAVLFSGFPWLTLSAAFAPWPFMIQGAAVLGAFGLGGLLVGLICLPAAASPGNRRVLLIGSLGGFVLLAGAGILRLRIEPLVRGTPLVVTLVQGNMDQGLKWTPELQRFTTARYLDLSLGALLRRPDTHLVVWPETAMPYDFERRPDLNDAVRAFVREHGTGLLLGTVGQEGVQSLERPYPLLFNRACLLLPEDRPGTKGGRIAGRYDKEHLVPFGEYLPPWPGLAFLEPLLQGVGNFTPGRSDVPPVLPARSSSEGPSEPLVLGVLICYETIFPESARRRAAEGAVLLVNLSNDAWFGRTAAPEQHLQLSVLRAVEQGRYLARATNTGVSAFVDPYGRTILSGGLFRAETLTAEVRPVTEHTVFFHLFPWLTPGAAFLLPLVLRGTPLRLRGQGCRHAATSRSENPCGRSRRTV